MGLDLNMDFLGGLAQKTNYANLMLQKQQMAEANKAKELQYANTLNTLKEQDTNTALKFLEQQDKAEQDLAGLAISDYDKKKLLEQEAILREKHISPLMEKYKGNPLEALKSEEGKAASLRYTNELKSHPDIQKYKRDANIVSESEKRQALGYEPLKVFRPETKQWYTPEEQVQAKEAGLLPNLEAHPYVKPTSFDAASYFQKLYPSTDKKEEYYKLEGRLPVSSDVYAQAAVEKQYPSIPVDTPRYKEYYNTAKKAYEEQQKQGNSLYYKYAESPEEKADMAQQRALRGYVAKKEYDASKGDKFGDYSVSNHVAQAVVYKDSRHPKNGTNSYDLVGTEMPMPLLKSDVNATANEFYTPSNTRIAGQNDPDYPPGTEVLEQGKTFNNAKVKILKDYKAVLLPVGNDRRIPMPGGKKYRVFFTAVSGEGGDVKIGYIPYSVAQPLLPKGTTYDDLLKKLSESLPTDMASVQAKSIAQAAATAAEPESSGVIADYNIKDYATNPAHETNVANIYNTTPTFNSKEDIDNEIKKVAPDSPLTGDMILKSANAYNVDPKLIFAIVKEDSSLGTKGLAVKTKNAGNVGNDDAGNLSYKKDWQDGIDAVAKWLANHKTTKSKSTETSVPTPAQAPAPATTKTDWTKYARN